MTPNFDLMDRVLAHIDAHPETWDQSTWHCGTTACFAGWACTLSAGVWVDENGEYLEPEQGVGNLVWTPTRAVEVLGLKEEFFEPDLFLPENTREDLGRIIDALKQEHGVVTSA